LDHSLIISSFGKRIKDGSILALLEKFLKSGVMVGEEWQASDVGSPQGSLCKALHKPPYAKKVIMQSNSKKFLCFSSFL
jgi:hypothetical protein